MIWPFDLLRNFDLNKKTISIYTLGNANIAMDNVTMSPWGCISYWKWGYSIAMWVDVSENSGTPKSSILIGFSIINHPFWGKHPYFWKHPYLDNWADVFADVPWRHATHATVSIQEWRRKSWSKHERTQRPSLWILGDPQACSLRGWKQRKFSHNKDFNSSWRIEKTYI